MIRGVAGWRLYSDSHHCQPGQVQLINDTNGEENSNTTYHVHNNEQSHLHVVVFKG